MPTPTTIDLLGILPQMLVGGLGILVLLVDSIWTNISRRFLAGITVLGLAGTAIITIIQWPGDSPAAVMQDMILPDGYTAFFTIILLIGGILSILVSTNYLQEERIANGEYYALLCFTILGGIVMAASVNLITLFLGLEILSISLYILAGFKTEDIKSDEAALKYFLLGAFASAFFLYGIALIYGATGHLNLARIAEELSQAATRGVAPSRNYLLMSGVGLLMVGFGFKVAVAPFHFWTPDVYQGAPTSATAFMSVIAKAAGFAAFMRVIGSAFTDQMMQFYISAVLASVAAITMIVGNFVAIVQKDVKRMLAYSSIAHAGYILTGLVAVARPGGPFSGTGDSQSRALAAVLFYTLVYTITNVGAFGVVMALRRRGEEVDSIPDYAGVARRHPGLAALMAIFMLSLAGLPPTAGFFGKLFLLQAITAMNSPLTWLLVVFALTSVVSFYYYLGIVRAMYMDSPEQSKEPHVILDWPMRIGLGLSAVGTLALGLWAGGAYDIALRVAQGFFGPGPFSAMR